MGWHKLRTFWLYPVDYPTQTKGRVFTYFPGTRVIPPKGASPTFGGINPGDPLWGKSVALHK